MAKLIKIESDERVGSRSRLVHSQTRAVFVHSMSSPPAKKSKSAPEQTKAHDHTDHPGKDCCSLAHAQDWVVTSLDTTLSAEVTQWLPEKIFDMHAHLWELGQFNQSDLGMSNQLLSTPSPSPTPARPHHHRHATPPRACTPTPDPPPHHHCKQHNTTTANQ